MTIKTAVTQTFLREYSLPYVPLDNGLQLQVLNSVSGLARCKKHHYAAFVKESGMLIVWDDEPSDIIRRIESIEQHLVEMLWTLGDSDAAIDEKMEGEKGPTVNVEEVSGDMMDEEQRTAKPRKTVIIQSFIVALSLVVMIFTLSIGWRELAVEVVIDKQFTRLGLLIATPLQVSLHMPCANCD